MWKMKRWIALMVVLGIVAAGSNAYAKAGPFKLKVEGVPVNGDAAPIVSKGRVLIPLRAASEALGANVAWDPKANKVTVTKWAESVELTVGKKTALVKGTSEPSYETALDVPVSRVGSRVYVPLRFLSQTFGYRAEWSGDTVNIRSPLSESTQKILYHGALGEARKLAMKMGVHYEHPALKMTRFSEWWSETYLFPEGEALRYLKIEGDTVSWVEFKDGFAVVTWQAHVNEDDALQQFLQSKWKDEVGTKPKLGKGYYSYSYGFAGVQREQTEQKIDPQGQIAPINSYINTDGKISGQPPIYQLPGEVRKEAVALPKPSPSGAPSFKPGVSIVFPKGKDADEETVLQLVKKNIEALAARDKEAFRATILNGGDYFDFLLEESVSFRFTDLEAIEPYDPETKRLNVRIGFDERKDGTVRHSSYIFTAIKDKAGEWKIASID
ncbi:hypothetical protein J19TS2_37110 [Cohnella xylanilytica]|nr:hypothetical protein J19TS2_37110 [Cohnella xylanilytica]